MLKAMCRTFLSLALVAVSSSIGPRPASGRVEGRAGAAGAAALLQKCPANSDPAYDRQAILGQLDRTLKKNIPFYKEFPLMGFFVYDLTDPSNYYKSPIHGLSEEGCVNFINNHVYHFSAANLATSKSQIAFLKDGKLRVFNSINCRGSKEKLGDVLRYASEKLKDGQNKDDTIARLKHYRRYGAYETVDHTEYACSGEEIPQNPDRLYSRRGVLSQFINSLIPTRTPRAMKGYPSFFIEEERAVGFFVHDLTEPSNKQSSLLERVEFRDNHVYHFADIELPFSFSNIAFLEGGKVTIFKAINCAGKGDSLEDVIRYLRERLKGDNKDETIKRLKDYRSYGVHASQNGSSTPRCEAIDTEE